jgi:hypothetical protein
MQGVRLDEPLAMKEDRVHARSAVSTTPAATGVGVTLPG